MKYIAIAIFGIFVNFSFAQQNNIIKELQDCSVTISIDGRSIGSGVIFTRQGINFVWTAAHVVEDCQSKRKILDKNGSEKTVVEFKDVDILREFVEQGRTVGKISMKARVLKYSDPNNGQDLAILQVRKKNFIIASVRFCPPGTIPDIGQEIIHIGSMRGDLGINSLTTGVISQVGRVRNKGTIYDQSSAAALPGSSGGGIFNKTTGECLGLVLEGQPPSMIFARPVREMYKWAAKQELAWAMYDNIPLPSNFDDINIIDGSYTNSEDQEQLKSDDSPIIKLIRR